MKSRSFCALSGVRILRQHGYPPDDQETVATTTSAEAELLWAEWVG